MKRYLFRLLLLTLICLMVACQETTNEPVVPVGPMVLDYNFGGHPTTLDPVAAIDSVSLDVTAQLFEGLTRFDSQQATAVPALAVDWDVSVDGLTYTFKLREDIQWVDQAGSPQRALTAEDVVFSIKRACDPVTAAPYSHILYPIRGCQELQESVVVPDLERVEVRALDPSIVEFTLNEPIAYFPILVSMPVSRVVPREVIEAYGDEWAAPEHLWSHEPYLLSEWQPEQQLTFIKNEHYHSRDDVAIVRINGVMLDDSQARERYLANQLDSTALSPSESELLRQALGGDAERTRIPDACSYNYGFTLVKAPLDNRRVRRALSLAIDRERMINEILQGGQLPARHFAPPFVFGALPLESLGITFDRQMAQELLAEAGYPNGHGFPTLTLLHPADEEQARIAQIIVAMWQTYLGINIELTSLPQEDYLSLMQSTIPLEEVPHIWVLGWCADYPDQHNWLYEVFNVNHTPSPTPTITSGIDQEHITIYAGGKHMRRAAGYLEELTEEAISIREPAERRTLYAEAEEHLVAEQAMIAPLYHHATNVFTKPWLQRTYSSVGGQYFGEWRIDMAMKEQVLRGEVVGEE